MVGRGDPSAEDLRPHPNVFKSLRAIVNGRLQWTRFMMMEEVRQFVSVQENRSELHCRSTTRARFRNVEI